MAFEAVVFGHSLVRGLKEYSAENGSWNLNLNRDNFRVFFHGIGGLSLHKHSLDDAVETVIALEPQAIILDLGANDLDRREKPHPYTVAKNIFAFARSIQRKTQAIVYIVQAYHRKNSRREDYSTVLPSFNKFIQDICKETNDNFIVYWPHRNINKNWENHLARDGVHLNKEGNRRYSRSIRGAILKAAAQARKTELLHQA